MKKSNLLPISKEGISSLLCLSALFVLLLLFDLEFLSFLAFILLAFTVYTFRNPERQLPLFEKSSIIAPSDGVVRSITELNEGEYAYKIDIESRFTDVGVLRAPMSGKLINIKKYHGTRVSKKSKLYNSLNEYTSLVISDENKNQLQVLHRLQQSFIALHVDLMESQTMHQTARYGFMHNGTTTLYLPQNVRLNIQVGNELNASESLIGYFS